MANSVAVAQTEPTYTKALGQGNVFFAHTGTTAVTFSAGLIITAKGLVVTNPLGSGKKLRILNASFQPSSAVAGTALLAFGPYSATAVTHTTAAVVRKAIGGGTATTGADCVAYADTGATLPVIPVAALGLTSVMSTNTGHAPAAFVDLGGCLECPPGQSVGVLSDAAITGWASIMWQEVTDDGVR